jgi:hypothetical protein
MTATLRERLAPWTGMFAGPLCWALNQQGFSSLLHFNCRLGSGTKGIVSFVVLAIVLIASGVVSWRWRGGTELQRFIGIASAGAAALFLLALIFQTAATLILPGCGS